MKALWSLALCSCCAVSQAFDAGPHQDLMIAAMSDFGFSSDAIGTARLNNWLVDYYSNTGSYEDELNLLHFDNLPTTHMVRVYWGYFTNNARRALQGAASANDPYKALSILGMSLHGVQDFYTHSTWVETHPRTGGYRAETYFTDTPSDSNTPQAGVYTGLYPGGSATNAADGRKYHGSYSWGVNHDNYNRPGNDEAIVFAYSASVQWIRATFKWVEAVRPGFFNSMLTFSDATNRADLNRDLQYMYYLSDWLIKPWEASTSNGRWKAFGSGSFGDFGGAIVAFQSTPDDNFTSNFKPARLWFRELTPGLSNPTGLIPFIEPVPAPNIHRRAIIVRTTAARDDTTLGLDLTSQADFYAVITIRGQAIVEPVARDKKAPTLLWNTIKLVPDTDTSVSITYSLWDEDVSFVGGFQGTDDHCDINPARGPYDLNFKFNVATHRCSGDVNGLFDTIGRLYASSGTDGNDSTVWFYVTESPVIEP